MFYSWGSEEISKDGYLNQKTQILSEICKSWFVLMATIDQVRFSFARLLAVEYENDPTLLIRIPIEYELSLTPCTPEKSGLIDIREAIAKNSDSSEGCLIVVLKSNLRDLLQQLAHRLCTKEDEAVIHMGGTRLYHGMGLFPQSDHGKESYCSRCDYLRQEIGKSWFIRIGSDLLVEDKRYSVYQRISISQSVREILMTMPGTHVARFTYTTFILRQGLAHDRAVKHSQSNLLNSH